MKYILAQSDVTKTIPSLKWKKLKQESEHNEQNGENKKKETWTAHILFENTNSSILVPRTAWESTSRNQYWNCRSTEIRLMALGDCCSVSKFSHVTVRDSQVETLYGSRKWAQDDRFCSGNETAEKAPHVYRSVEHEAKQNAREEKGRAKRWTDK